MALIASAPEKTCTEHSIGIGSRIAILCGNQIDCIAKTPYPSTRNPMAITNGHGNPAWTHDEVILALELYLESGGQVPGPNDERVVELSRLLRSLPHHEVASKQESFRNPSGVAFKLQNLRQVATGKGLSNVSKVDREVWTAFGNHPVRATAIANLIRAEAMHHRDAFPECDETEVFAEGWTATKLHLRRERNRGLRRKLLDQRRLAGRLSCDICACAPVKAGSPVHEAMFESHHMLPLATGGERLTRLKDMALLCANCHRMLHRAIVITRRWMSIDEASSMISERSTGAAARQ